VGVSFIKMFPSKGSGPRSTLLEMLDSISVQEKETMEVLPPPLPVRPSSRARLPSSVIKARKHLVLDHVTPPTSKSSTVTSTPEKNSHMCDSPMANLASSANSEMCTPRPYSSQLALDSCSGDESAIGNVQTVSRVMVDEGSSDLVTSPSFIPGACKLAEAREGEGGAAVSDCRDIGYDSQQPVVISAVQEVEVGQPTFSFLTSESTLPPHTPVQQDPVAAVPMTPPTTGRKWKDDGTLRLKKVCNATILNSSWWFSFVHPFCLLSSVKWMPGLPIKKRSKICTFYSAEVYASSMWYECIRCQCSMYLSEGVQLKCNVRVESCRLITLLGY
jgi:hypothetical protein